MKLKKISILASTLLIAVSLTGCNFTIPFDKLLSNETTKTENEAVVKVDGLNLNNTILTKDDIKTYQTLINKFIEKLQDKDVISYAFKSNMYNFYSSFKDYLNNDYYTAISNKKDTEDLSIAIKDLFKDNKMKIASGTLTSVKYSLNTKKIVFDINGENEDLGFHIKTMEFTLDNSNKVTKITSISEINDADNTATPLTENSQLIDNSSFNSSFELFKKQIKNKDLYDKVQQNNYTEDELNGFLSEVEIKIKNNDALKNIFLASGGNLSDYSVTEIEYNDKDATAQTIYTIAIPQIKSPFYFKVYFNRISCKIEKVTLI